METEVYEKSIFDDEQIIVAYAGFWQRFGALFLDGLILLPLTIVNVYNHTTWKSTALLAIVNLAALTYKPLLEYLYGATLGKKALSIAVVNRHYIKPTLQEATLRNIFAIVLGLLSLVLSILLFNSAEFKQVTTFADYNQFQIQHGYSSLISVATFFIYIVDVIVLLADKQKRSLHDLIAKTYVINK